MSTATLERPANQQANGASPAVLAPLWGDIELPIIVGTGEFGQGKTLFGLTICPGPQTLCYDHEGSSLTYRSLDFEHVDMAGELLKKHPDGYTAEQRYLWWREDALTRGKNGGRGGKFRVLMVDPASEVEDGLAEHIKKNCTKFGLTSNQIDKSPGLFWGAMKKEWKFVLDTLRAFYATTYMTVHLRDEFRGNAPTGKREPKGKETLFELASLFLWFEREKDAAGNVSAVPSANVLKSRLAKTIFDDGEVQIVPILPPRLPKATPKAIRDYIAKPPNYSKLKEGERAKEHEMSEDERLQLKAKIAADEADSARAKLTFMERMQQSARLQAQAQSQVIPAPDAAAELAAKNRESAAASVHPPISESQVAKIAALFPQAFGTDDAGQAALAEWMPQRLAACGVAKVRQLTQQQGDDLIIDLTNMEADRKSKLAAARGAELTAQQQPPAPPDPNEVPFDHATAPKVDFPPESIPSTPVGPITAAQIERIKSLFPLAYKDNAELSQKFPPLLRCFNKQKVSDLNESEATATIHSLEHLARNRGVDPGQPQLPLADGENQPAKQVEQPKPADSAVTDRRANSTVTREQLQELAKLAEQAGWTYDEQLKWLAARGVQTARSLSTEQAAERIAELQRIIDGFSGGVPKN